MSTTRSYYSEDRGEFAEYWQEEFLEQPSMLNSSKMNWLQAHPEYEGLSKAALTSNLEELLHRTRMYCEEAQRMGNAMVFARANELGAATQECRQQVLKAVEDDLWVMCVNIPPNLTRYLPTFAQRFMARLTGTPIPLIVALIEIANYNMQCLRFDLETQWQPYPEFQIRKMPDSQSAGTSQGYEKVANATVDI